MLCYLLHILLLFIIIYYFYYFITFAGSILPAADTTSLLNLGRAANASKVAL